ncbi:MAG: DNA-directed RNA polymerase subunit beta', partial [Bacteroidales bacterium]|nr:DNA-directed RNA polymerase subunit beta' [Bacteroidales bacterium]
ILSAGDEITEDLAALIESLPIEQVEIRSVLTCESRKGVCAKCYGRNLATGRMVEKGEVVGVIAAQSIGEPGTQLTLRTFHVGGTASNIAAENEIRAKENGILLFEEVRTIKKVDDTGEHTIVVGRTGEMTIVNEETGIELSRHNIPYGTELFFANEAKVNKGDLICHWDAYNALTISEIDGIAKYEFLVDGVTYREETDDISRDKVIIESRDKVRTPSIRIVDEQGNELKQHNLPVGAHVNVEDGQRITVGDILFKIPRAIGKSGDITGGLPRVTELFEARNPSNPAIVSEINGEVIMGKARRGNREIIVRAKTGEEKHYLVPLSKQIMVQENDYVRAGMALSDGAISPSDILAILGPIKVQEYIVNEIQEVYRMQGVKINDKHFEVIVRQMMRKVQIVEPGDTHFLPEQLVDKWEFIEENDNIFDKKVVTDPGDSKELHAGQIVTVRRLRDENSILKRQDLKLVEARNAVPATSNQILQGITRAALRTNSFMSAASFQETTKVLGDAAIRAKVDYLEGLKENVICGHLIPAGTGQREYDKLIVASMDDYNRMMSGK